MTTRASAWLGLTMLAGLGCGGGGGGGAGGAPTHIKDDLGNDNFIPALGETAAVATLDFPGTAGLLTTVVYSASDPDLFLATAEALYVGRVSTKKIERYCGAMKPPTYVVEQEPTAAYFKLEGDQLIFFAPSISTEQGMLRYVCTHDAIVSQDQVVGSPAITQGYAWSTLPVADGFWGLTPPFGTPTQIVHVKYDGTVDKMAAPPSTEHATEPVGAAFYFHQDATVTKFDVATQMTSVVANGVSGTLVYLSARGLAMTGPPAQVVAFAKGTAPVTLAGSIPVTAAAGTVGEFIEEGGGGALLGARYDLTTGALTSVTYSTTPTSIITQYLTPTGQLYALEGTSVHHINVWTKALASGSVVIDPGKPDLSLAPYPVDVPGSAGRPSFLSYADGSCLFMTGSGQGGTPRGGTSISPVIQGPNRTLSAGRCGATSAKTILVGFSGFAYDSAFGGLLRRPFFTAAHTRDRATPCAGTCASTWETTDRQSFESAWTLDASGAPLPLYAVTNGAWPRPRTLKNFVVRHDDKLVVLAGPP
jgi:hypothetical protein